MKILRTCSIGYRGISGNKEESMEIGRQVWIIFADEDELGGGIIDPVAGVFSSLEDAWGSVKADAIAELEYKQDHMCTVMVFHEDSDDEVWNYPADVMIRHLQMYPQVQSSLRLEFGANEWRSWNIDRYPVE